MIRKIQNVIFDIGAVLIGFDWDAYMAHLFDDEQTREAVTAAMWHNDDWHELDRGAISLDEVLALFTENAPEYAGAIREALYRLGEAPTRQPYAIEWVEALKARGLRVYYLSNYFEFLMKEAPQVLDFIPHMQGGVFSCQEHLLKPDPAIYRVLCDRYGLEPEECVFIDDTQINVDAARAFGMQAIRFESYAQASEALDSLL